MDTKRKTFSSDDFKIKLEEAKKKKKIGRKGHIGKCITEDCVGQSLYALGYMEMKDLLEYQHLINTNKNKKLNPVFGIEQMYFFLKSKYENIGVIKYDIKNIKELLNDIGDGKVYLANGGRKFPLSAHAFLIGKFETKDGDFIPFIWDNQNTIFNNKPILYKEDFKRYIDAQKFINISIFRSIKEIKKLISEEQKTQKEYVIETPDSINDDLNIYNKKHIDYHKIFKKFKVKEKKQMENLVKETEKLIAEIDDQNSTFFKKKKKAIKSRFSKLPKFFTRTKKAIKSRLSRLPTFFRKRRKKKTITSRNSKYLVTGKTRTSISSKSSGKTRKSIKSKTSRSSKSSGKTRKSIKSKTSRSSKSSGKTRKSIKSKTSISSKSSGKTRKSIKSKTSISSKSSGKTRKSKKTK